MLFDQTGKNATVPDFDKLGRPMFDAHINTLIPTDRLRDLVDQLLLHRRQFEGFRIYIRQNRDSWRSHGNAVQIRIQFYGRRLHQLTMKWGTNGK